MKTVFFLDIDDCLIETSRLGRDELNALENSLKMMGIPHSGEITLEFEASFHRLYDHHQGKVLPAPEMEKLDAYYARLGELQREIVGEYGQIKKWSREVFLYIAAGKCGIRLTSDQIDTAAVELWKAITANNPFYPDSLPFLEKLRLASIPFYLISASDCRLVYDGNRDLFTYDPVRSKNLKLKRLDKFVKIGVPEKNIFVGDPYDKPDPWVFRSAFTRAEEEWGRGFGGIMVGDSISNDLAPAWSVGIRKLYLINRHYKKVANDSGLEISEIREFSQIRT